MAKFNTKSISNKGAYFFLGGGGGGEGDNVPENWAKTSLPWLHFKTEHALHREENKVEFFEGPFLWKSSFPPQKENWAFFWTFSFHFCLLTVNLEMQNSGLKTTAWWSRGSYFVENRHPYLRFPNMVKVTFHEHWTWVTRFNPLIWVSGVFNILRNLRLIYNKQKIKDVKASAWMRHSSSCNYTVLYKKKGSKIRRILSFDLSKTWRKFATQFRWRAQWNFSVSLAKFRIHRNPMSHHQ